jgi:hypothetical protein
MPIFKPPFYGSLILHIFNGVGEKKSVCSSTRPNTICPGGWNRSLLVSATPVSNFEPVEITLCANGWFMSPASTVPLLRCRCVWPAASRAGRSLAALSWWAGDRKREAHEVACDSPDGQGATHQIQASSSAARRGRQARLLGPCVVVDGEILST